MIEITIGLMVFILGIMIGSFLNVVIYRIPNDESIVFPASKCQSCQTPLKWYHNIPLASWLLLGGKCGFCKTAISKQYPLVELLTGVIFLALYFKLGLVWYLPFVAASFTALFALVMIDFKYMAVPDSVNFAALLFALVQPDIITALLNTAMAAGGLYLIGLLSSLLAKKQAMGGADVIVAGTMGALLGFPNFFVAIFLSALLAMIPALLNRENGVPFVPFLALATLIVYLYDTQATQLLETIIYG
ncbi:MAG TPA: prepilin peptidase [Sulfurovum sp.]|jgi:leader peptidase (prepilin peptidase)/N-methyltransferase|nr:MAG: prepilin peptidase [Sulfurovum sp. 35-42-20]OYY57434.1 MAG: prepilin peptidase [Sulfurovum sp. 28-43-6]OYZ25139.1 MAG: prepilin peptidase [Sulfurovum sp. 16-42-52]OYZ50153.1 MAG: prepilin peptidase [Sulfurovum sp. 24-42-9]OZA44325.1 MAG: prepilin peptidase [Sulfurovum sp. 17-42-90]OZA60061.1 MAG: prepilin peptidase [Sulfurovum sp. 39-42-12]HQR73078.1 prepilin peptidase [Sulfurovum sp.]